MLKRLSDREKILLLIVIIILCTAVFYLYLYQPLVGRIDTLQGERADRVKQLNLIVTQVKKIPELRTRVENLTQKKQVDSFVSEFSSKAVLNRLVIFARETGLRILNYTPEHKDNSIKVTFLGMGSYAAISDFITDLSRWDDQIRISQLSVQPRQEELSLEMEFTYYRKG